jgi:hypothetical protein
LAIIIHHFCKRFLFFSRPWGAWKLCKPKLEDDIIKSSRMSDPESLTFQGVLCRRKLGRFKANLANLRQKMATLDRAIQDDEAFQHDEDHALLAASHKPRWIIGSPEAPQERHGRGYKCQFEPATLQATRPEYACFDPKVFRKHVHQEKRSLGKPILVKKKEDKNKKNKKGRQC